MSAIADWTVEDLLVLLTHDLDRVDIRRIAGRFVIIDEWAGGFRYTDLTPLVDEAIRAKLMTINSRMLCLTGKGYDMARDAEQEQFIASIVWNTKKD